MTRDCVAWLTPFAATQAPVALLQVAPTSGGLAGCVPILTVKRVSRKPAVTSRSSMRDAATVVGMLPYLPANSVTAVFIELAEPMALVTRDEAMVEKTLGTITTARMAMMASTPIISTKLKPDWC